MPLAARVITLLLLLVPGPGLAEVYRWTDEQGRLHFSQSLSRVPARFREAARSSAGEPRAAIQTYRAPVRAPSSGGAAAPGATLRIPFQRYGSLMRVSARLNDRLSVPFLVDTGASGISLPRAAADSLGLRIGPETPRVLVRTANGVVSEPVVRLASVQLGAARVEDLTATVSESMSIGLLGGSFFNNFVYGVDAAQGVITLRPNQGIRAGAAAEEWRARFRALRRSLRELDGYLESRDITRQGRREELERRQRELREELAGLEREATQAGVPAAWRE